MHDYIRKSRGDYYQQNRFEFGRAGYQIRWRPWVSTEFWLNQSFSRLKWGWPYLQRNDERRPPEHTHLDRAGFSVCPGSVQIERHP